jgi:hypothetical protein
VARPKVQKCDDCGQRTKSYRTGKTPIWRCSRDHSEEPVRYKTWVQCHKCRKRIIKENAAFRKAIKSLARKWFPPLYAYDLISIQPITQPTVKLFYQDFKRDSDGEA